MQSIDLLNTVANNLLDGILPDFSVFGATFTAPWQKLLFGLWVLAILVLSGFIIRGLLGIAQHHGAQQSPIHPSHSREEH